MSDTTTIAHGQATQSGLDAATLNGTGASPIELAEAITAIAAGAPPLVPAIAPIVHKQPMGVKQRRTIG